MFSSATRSGIMILAGLAMLLPIGLIFYQSILSEPFFSKEAQLSLAPFIYVFEDPDFWPALWNSILIAVGTTAIALPVGAALAFLMARTDLPFKRILEPLLLLPILTPSIVLALGYVVAAGPVGFYSEFARRLFGFIPWSIYSPVSLFVLGGFMHVPFVYLYVAAALKNLGSDLEEAARITGASPWRVATAVSLPMVTPALVYSGLLVFFAGVTMFGLPLILGSSNDFELLTVYLYKLTNRFSYPSYQLIAAVAVVIIFITMPLIFLQRTVLKVRQKFVTIGGKSGRQRLIELGKWRWLALAIVLAWLIVTFIVPVSGIVLRAFVVRWGPTVNLLDVLTLEHFRGVFAEPTLVRAIVNSIVIGVVGGALAVACYTIVGLAVHRQQGGWARVLDYLVLVPNAVPGLLIGLAFLWVFLFVAPLTPLRSTPFSIWLAYTVVWFAYGMRLISGALLQVGAELEESARTVGASRGRVIRDIVLPLISYGLLAAWLLIFMAFESEYSAGVYLLSVGTEVIGSLLVVFSDGGGGRGTVAALSVINLALIGVGLAIALRWGVKIRG